MIWMWAVVQAFAGAPSPGREEAILSYDQWGVFPGAPEEKAYGPDHLAAGPLGLAALVDPTRSRVMVLRDLQLEGSFLAWGVDDLGFTEEGQLLLLRGRTISLVRTDGTALSEMTVPDLVPTSIVLQVEGSRVWGADAFGNRHAIAEIGIGGLSAPDGRSYQRNPTRALIGVGQVTIGAWSFPVAGGAKMGVRVVDNASVAVVDALVDTSPIRVSREIVTPSARWTLDLAGRQYAPVDDVAVGSDGTLIWFEPLADGLHLYRTKP